MSYHRRALDISADRIADALIELDTLIDELGLQAEPRVDDAGVFLVVKLPGVRPRFCRITWAQLLSDHVRYNRFEVLEATARHLRIEKLQKVTA